MSVLPWLEPLAEQVRTRLGSGRLPHALLVAGPEGWGELEFAGWLAMYLLGADEAGDAATLAHPDLRWVEPDGAEIKVPMVRELVEFAHGTPQAGPRKVAVLAHAHALNRNAANALLKTLEEPPAGTHLVLATSRPRRLLPTVRSRCQTLTIRPDAEAARAWLATRVEAGDLEQRMFEHGGAPVTVAAGVEQGEQPLEPLLIEALRTPVSVTAKVLWEQDLADALGRWYRYVLALAAGSRQLAALGPVPRRALLDFADELTWVRRQLLTSNSANGRLLAERLVAKWTALGAQGAGAGRRGGSRRSR